MVNQGRRSIAVAALALASGAGYAILAAAGDLRERGGVFLLVWAVLAAAYLLAIRLARPLEPEGPALCLIIGAAIAFRLVMLCAPVSLSDDVHRYVRDGAAQVEGINPYANAPADDPDRKSVV